MKVGEQMSILNREELIKRVRNYVGEDISDEAISFVEDITDTFDSVERADPDRIYTQADLDALDASWRNRYRDRFYASTTDEIVEDEPIVEEQKTYSYDELFTESEV